MQGIVLQLPVPPMKPEPPWMLLFLLNCRRTSLLHLISKQKSSIKLMFNINSDPSQLVCFLPSKTLEKLRQCKNSIQSGDGRGQSQVLLIWRSKVHKGKLSLLRE